jgi:interferon, gamma-inducible protein 30
LQNKHFKFIYCVDDLVMKHKYREWESCFAKLGFDPKPVSECHRSEHGHEVRRRSLLDHMH